MFCYFRNKRGSLIFFKKTTLFSGSTTLNVVCCQSRDRRESMFLNGNKVRTHIRVSNLIPVCIINTIWTVCFTMSSRDDWEAIMWLTYKS